MIVSIAGCCEYDLELFLVYSSANVKRYVCFFGDVTVASFPLFDDVCVQLVGSWWIKEKK